MRRVPQRVRNKRQYSSREKEIWRDKPACLSSVLQFLALVAVSLASFPAFGFHQIPLLLVNFLFLLKPA